MKCKTAILFTALILLPFCVHANDNGKTSPSKQGEADIGPTEIEKALKKRGNSVAPYYPTGAPDDVHIYFLGQKNKLFRAKKDGWDIQPADDPFANVISMPDPEKLDQPRHVQPEHMLTVQPGDTIRNLALRALGRAGLSSTPSNTEKSVKGLKSANPDVDFDRIVPGQTLVAPQFIQEEIAAHKWTQRKRRSAQPEAGAEGEGEGEKNQEEARQGQKEERTLTTLPDLPPLDQDTAPETPEQSPSAEKSDTAPRETYEVQSGDVVSTIARDYLRRHFGQAPRQAINELTDKIIQQNKVRPTALSVGQTLIIPAHSLQGKNEGGNKESVQSSEGQDSERSSMNAVEYTTTDTTTVRSVAIGYAQSIFGDTKAKTMVDQLREDPSTKNALSDIASRTIELNDELDALESSLPIGTTILLPPSSRYK